MDSGLRRNDENVTDTLSETRNDGRIGSVVWSDGKPWSRPESDEG